MGVTTGSHESWMYPIMIEANFQHASLIDLIDRNSSMMGLG